MNRQDIRELVLSLCTAVVAFIIIQSAVQTSIVDGPSMEPLLRTGERLLINKAAYWHLNADSMVWLPAATKQAYRNQDIYVFAAPQRGDLVVFYPPGGTGELYIKRVIGLPGEMISVQNGNVYINGTGLVEPYTAEAPRYEVTQTLIPAGFLFVMGDNRNHSSDSHLWGLLPRQNVVGRAEFRLWPFNPGTAGIAQFRSISAQK